MIINFNKYLNPVNIVIISFIILFFQQQITFYVSGLNFLKIFQLYNILIFIFISPFLLKRKISRKNILLFLTFILIFTYCNIILALKYFGILSAINGFNLINYKLWEITSTYNYLSFLSLASIFFLLKYDELKILFKIVFVSSLVVFIEMLIYLTLKLFGFGDFWIDVPSGNKFYSRLILDSSSTGMLMLLGYFYFVIYYLKNKLNLLFLIGFVFFLLAIVITKDRYIILTYVFFNLFFILKFVSKTYFKYFIILIFFIIMLFTIVLINNLKNDNKFSVDNYSIKVNEVFNTLYADTDGINTIFSIKSTMHRITLVIRSYEITKYFFPYGMGPGSYRYFMQNDDIEFKIFNNLRNYEDNNHFIINQLLNEIKLYHQKTGPRESCVGLSKCEIVNGKGVRTISAHNILIEIVNSLGFVGIFFALILVIIIIIHFFSFVITSGSHINTTKLATSVFLIPLNFDSTYTTYFIFGFVLAISNFDIKYKKEQ